jgi:hypothetical protein
MGTGIAYAMAETNKSYFSNEVLELECVELLLHALA